MPALKIKSGIHYTKKQPAETHVLVSASPADDSNEALHDNKTAIPNTGNFTGTALFSDASGNATTGKFSLAPDGSVAYCNGVTTNIWSGEEARTPAFLLGDSTGPSTAISYDYSVEINDTLSSTGHVATLKRAADTKVYMYIGSIRPLKGIKFYVANENNDTASTAINYWSGSAWTTVGTVTDGTSSSGKTLTQTGSMTFSDTSAVAQLKVISNRVLYFYQVVVTGFTTDTVTVYYCTLDMAVQSITDIWDGQTRRFVNAEVRLADTSATAGVGNVTAQLSSINLVYGDRSTYFDVDNNEGITNNSLCIGFLERMRGLYCVLAPGDDPHTGTITVSYWNGTAWASVSSQSDGTTPGFSTTGWITWTPPTLGTEQRRAFSGEIPLYYYRITFSGTFDSWLDHVAGMPVPTELEHYEIPALWQNRLVLLSAAQGKKNSARISSYGTTCVFNGNDSLYIDSIGDEERITAAGSVFSRDTNGFYDTLVICKNKETWVLDGTTIQNYRLFKISDRHGCVAPQTFRTIQLGLAKGNSRHIAIWQSATGIIAFDGSTIIELSADIKNYFEKENSEAITTGLVDQSSAFVDEREQEYHWLFASGTDATAINTELVFSFTREAWFKIDRTPVLLCGIPVHSTIGDAYVYGGTATGYLERLENPSADTFDGNTITHTITTRDIPMENWNQQSVVRRIKLVTKANSGVDATIAHVADGNVAIDTATVAAAVTNAAKRIVQKKGSINWGHNVFHGFQIVVAGNSGTTLFEPVAITGFYQDIRIDI